MTCETMVYEVLAISVFLFIASLSLAVSFGVSDVIDDWRKGRGRFNRSER